LPTRICNDLMKRQDPVCESCFQAGLGGRLLNKRFLNDECSLFQVFAKHTRIQLKRMQALKPIWL
jgi:hypothetical protein